MTYDLNTYLLQSLLRRAAVPALGLCVLLLTACAGPLAVSAQPPVTKGPPPQGKAPAAQTPTRAPAATTMPAETTSASGCGAGFLKVTAHARNAAYAAPLLNVSCDGTRMTVRANGIPNFEFVQTTPNRLLAQNYTWSIPQKPARAGATTAVPLGGVSAIAVNGLPIFGPTEAPNDGYRDPYLDRILDFCNGHTAQRGDYHFHARPDCMGIDTGKPGTVIGYALDGYPILSPVVCADAGCTITKRLKSSWQLTNASKTAAWEKHSYVAGSGDLDRCNGRTQPDGGYAYYATDSFPYFIGCYTGSPVLAGVPR